MEYQYYKSDADYDAEHMVMIELAISASLENNNNNNQPDLSHEMVDIDFTGEKCLTLQTVLEESLKLSREEQEHTSDFEGIDRAIALSLQDAEEEKQAKEEFDFAIALSLNEQDLIQDGYWMCRFCSFYSPSNLIGCVMCNLEKSYSIEPSSSSSASSSSSSTKLTGTTSLVANTKRYCALPGCRLISTYYDYCTEEHCHRARKRSLLPPAEFGVHSVLVGNTGEFTAHLLTKANPDHSTMKNLFLNGWLKKEIGNPHVMRIYKIQNAPVIDIAFQHMKEAIGNSQLRFHGTSQHIDCMFGSNPSIPPCDRNDCRVCSICRHSFSTKFAGQTGGSIMNLRYGQGLYFSATSSKSHDYNKLSEKILRTGDHRKRPWAWRSMFVCQVVIGKAFQTYDGELPSHQCPPIGK